MSGRELAWTAAYDRQGTRGHEKFKSRNDALDFLNRKGDARELNPVYLGGPGVFLEDDALADALLAREQELEEEASGRELAWSNKELGLRVRAALYLRDEVGEGGVIDLPGMAERLGLPLQEVSRRVRDLRGDSWILLSSQRDKTLKHRQMRLVKIGDAVWDPEQLSAPVGPLAGRNQGMRVDDPDRRVLLRLAVGRHNERRETQFRHKETGETRRALDMRIHRFKDWAVEGRTVIETEWT